MAATLGLAFLAGLATVLSPCVLPLVPLAMGAAATEHRFGPVALAAGLTLSFVAIGLFVATVGYSLGIDEDAFRPASALLLIGLGAALLLPAAQARFAMVLRRAGDWAAERLEGADRAGFWGQFGVGALLGAVWTPCVGPTLGAASVLASRGEHLPAVAAVMAAFGGGAALPLLLIGSLSRAVLARWRPRMAGAGRGAKAALGVLLIAVGFAVLTRYDRVVETALVDASPEWLTALTTRY